MAIVYWLVVGAANLLCVAAVAWGIVVRTRRRRLVARARRAEDERLRIEQARVRERKRIARECTEDLHMTQPGLGDIGTLVEEFRTAGTTVMFTPLCAPPDSIPPTTGRHGYRIVQEGLTNACKHAPGQPVTIVLSGAAGNGLAIEIRNPLTGTAPGDGSRVGLAGLTERAKLAGGTLEHGPTTTNNFRLHAWLPWPTGLS